MELSPCVNLRNPTACVGLENISFLELMVPSTISEPKAGPWKTSIFEFK
jgi:hypothetical protein